MSMSLSCVICYTIFCVNNGFGFSLHSLGFGLGNDGLGFNSILFDFGVNNIGHHLHFLALGLATMGLAFLVYISVIVTYRCTVLLCTAQYL